MSYTDHRRDVIIQWMFPAAVLAKHLQKVIENKCVLPREVPEGARVRLERFFTFALQGEKTGDPFLRANFALVQQLILPATDVVVRSKSFLSITQNLVNEKWILPPEGIHYIKALHQFLCELHKLGQKQVGVKIAFAVDRTTS